MARTLLQISQSIETEDTIEHYGIPGMKWGIRKTKKSSGVKTLSKRQRTKLNRKISKATATKWKTKYQNRGNLSNKELKKSIERLRLENQFAEQVRISNGTQFKSPLKKSSEKFKNNFGDSVSKGFNKGLTAGVAGLTGAGIAYLSNPKKRKKLGLNF